MLAGRGRSAQVQFAVAFVAAALLVLALGAGRADALLKSVTKVAPVTNVVQPVTEPLATTVQQTTTTLSSTVDATVAAVDGTHEVDGVVRVNADLNEATFDALNVIPKDYDPVTPLAELLGGTQGFPSSAEQLLCQPLQELAQLAQLAGAGLIGDGLATLACTAGLLEYRFFTRFKDADGTLITRTHVATLGVPMPLDVDADIEPDLIGTITLTGVNSVGLVVDRMPGETATLPVAVEAVLRDPTRGSLGREHIAFGYDARDDRAPGRFALSTPVDTVLAPQPEFSFTVSQQERGERVALIGGLFDGALEQRENPAEVRLDYFASPDLATVTARIGDDETYARLTTNRPGRTDVSGRIVEATEEQRFGATLADLPGLLEVTIAQGDGVDAAITASAPIAGIDGSFERVRNIGPSPVVLQKALVDLDDVPVGVRVRMSDEQGTVSTTGGPIGRTKVGVADGEPRFLAENAYAYVSDTGGVRSLATVIPGLRSASFALGAAPRISAHLTSTPFLARIEDAAQTIDARIVDLPERFDIGIDLEGGVLDYDGHGDGIERIEISGDGTEPFFGRATKLRGLLAGIPARMTATLALEGETGEVRVDGGAIGKLELVASNGPEELPAGDGQGVVYRDVTGGDFVVGARILDLRRIAYSSGEGIGLETHTAGGPFSLVAQTDDFTAGGRIADLPAKSAITADLDGGRITFSGRDADDQPAGIATLDLDVVAQQPLFGRATNIDVTIGDIPADVTLDISQSGSGARIEGSEAIGLIELVAANRAPAAGDLPVNGEQGAKLVDLEGGEYAIGARIRQLKKLDAAFGDQVRLSAETEGGPFGVRVTTDDLRGFARIEDLPAKLDATLDLAAGRLTVQGRDAGGDPQGIDRVILQIGGPQPLFGKATDVDGVIEGIPADVTVDIAQTGTGVGITASEPIDLIELVAADRAITDRAADLPAGGAQGAVYRDTASAYLLSARVRELQQLNATLDGALALRAKTAGGPFLVTLETAGIAADARLLDLPADVEVGFDPADGTLTYRGKTASGDPAGVGLVTLEATSAEPLIGRADRVSARIEDLAPEVDLQIDADNDGGPRASVEASEPITRVEFLASDGATAYPAPLDDAGAQGIVLHDRAGQPYAAALRILELRKAVMGFEGDAVAVETETAGGPFKVDVDTDPFGIVSSVEDLPARANLAVDLAAGQVTFAGADAGGQPKGIDLLTIEARLAEPFLGRGNRLSARIEKLPAQVTLGFSQTAGRANIDASAPVQLIELFGWEDGEPKPTFLPAQGARLYDRTGEPFQLAARVRQLERLSVDFGDAVDLSTKTAGGLFVADIRTEDLAAYASIEDLPATLDLALDLGSGQVTYAGSSAIDRIYASIDSTEPVFLGAKAFEVDLKQVPQAFTLGLGSDVERIQLSADNPIGQIDVRARSANRSFPALPVDQAGAILDSTNDELALALRVFGLKKLDVTLEPIAIDAEMSAGRTFLVDAKLDQESGTPLDLDALIDVLPSRVKLGMEDIAAGGSKLVLDGSAPINLVRLNVRGLELLPGADKVDVEINSLPQKVTVELPETGSLARIEARNGAGVLTPIGQLRLAASNGAKSLPAFVSDATYNANPANTAYRDRLEFDNSPTSFGVALRLTGPKVIDVNLDPIALTLEQDSARTRPIAIDARIPNSSAGQPDTTVTGVLNKPSARTVIGIDLIPGEPTRLRFENAAAVGSLSLNAANLGTIPQADFTLANIPTKLSVCMNTDSQCRRTDRLPTAHGTYGGSHRSPTQSGTAGGNNRPYPAQVSMNFDDEGTSGTSFNISSMVTLNATVKLNASDPPIRITNLRFHTLSLDLGQHPTNPSFTYLGSSVPRIYMFIDSVNKPFVMNEIKYPPTIESFKIGSDGDPAVGDRRLVWLPGTYCVTQVFGACVVTGLDRRSNGNLQCNGARALTIKVLGININLLNFLGTQILPVCSD